jgi:hypothetical protein
MNDHPLNHRHVKHPKFIRGFKFKLKIEKFLKNGEL